MAGRIVISTLGFSTDPVFKLLAAIPIDKHTRIYLIAPHPPSPGTKRAYNTVKTHLGDRVGGVELVTIPNNPWEALATLATIMREEGEYIVSPSGGMRYLVTLVTIATAAFRPNAEVIVISESGEIEDTRLGPGLMEFLMKGLSATEELILRTVSKGPMTEAEMASALGKSEKTVKNAVSSLRRLGLVRKVGRRATVKLTKAGEAALRILDTLRSRRS